MLAFTAPETARIRGTTTAAMKSGLQRARARLDALGERPEDLLEPTDRRARALLEGYIAAFERSNVGLLEQVLRTDATLEATPFRDWYAGRALRRPREVVGTNQISVRTEFRSPRQPQNEGALDLKVMDDLEALSGDRPLR